MVADSEQEFLMSLRTTLLHSFLKLCLAIAFAVVLTSHSLPAQKQAACTFSFFKIDFSNMVLTPEGINDFGTIVGSTTRNTAFIRWSNGGLSFPAGVTDLVNRNNSGKSAGYDLQHNAILLDRGSLSSIYVTIGTTSYSAFGIGGINTWGTIAGWISDSNGLNIHGLKRFFGSPGVTFDFPGTKISGTFANAINDSGTIVGNVNGIIPNHTGMGHGFINHGGTWAALDFPHATGTKTPITMLVGIANSGVIVGDAFLDPTNELSTAFLYKDGVFELIVPPHMVSPRVMGMSLKSGLIVGWGYPPQGLHPQRGFVAKCN
jgi:hypothetical protein